MRICICICMHLYRYMYLTKNVVFNAVIRAKLMYGLESVQLNQTELQKLNTIQLKCLRRILNMTTTFVNRENTNAKVSRKRGVDQETLYQ